MANGTKHFQLWRLDDNNNEVLVEVFVSERAAHQKKKEFEDRGHKQAYWVKCVEKTP